MNLKNVRKEYLAAFVVVVVFVVISAALLNAYIEDSKYIKGMIRVEFKNDVSEIIIYEIVESQGCEVIGKPFPTSLPNFYDISIPENMTVPEMVELFQKMPEVESARGRKIGNSEVL